MVRWLEILKDGKRIIDPDTGGYLVQKQGTKDYGWWIEAMQFALPMELEGELD